MGECVTQVLDRDRISEIKYVISSIGDIVYIDGNIILINPDGRLAVRVKCIVPGKCNLDDATTPARKMGLGDANNKKKQITLLPEGNVVFVTDPETPDHKVYLRVVEGNGTLYVYDGDYFLGAIHAPTKEEQEMGIESVGELDTEEAELVVREQREQIQGNVMDPDTPDLIKNNDSIGTTEFCNVTPFRKADFDLSSPSFMLTALLFLVATRFSREGSNSVEKAQQVARDLARRLFKK